MRRKRFIPILFFIAALGCAIGIMRYALQGGPSVLGIYTVYIPAILEVHPTLPPATPTPSPVHRPSAVIYYPETYPTQETETTPTLIIPTHSPRLSDTDQTDVTANPTPVHESSRDTYPKEIFSEVNSYRVEKGMSPYTWNDGLAGWAQERANAYISIGGMDGHDGFKAEFETRAKQFKFMMLGENSFYGNKKDARALIRDVFASSGPHNANLLSTEFTHMGVGVGIKDGTIYAVDLVFGGKEY